MTIRGIGGAGLKACVNGARLPHEHPALPVTPSRLAREAHAVQQAGAGAVHLHVKDAEGRDTFDAAALTDVLLAVRSSAPGLPIGVTTGAWALPDPLDRVAAVQAWREVPDFASVNWHESGADEVALALMGRGIGVEAGLWHADGVRAWAASPLRERCLRVLVELPDGLGDVESVAVATDLLDRVEAVGTGLPVLVHGEGSSAWPTLRFARQRGRLTRIGLEDTLLLPDGTLAESNAQLVRTALALV